MLHNWNKNVDLLKIKKPTEKRSGSGRKPASVLLEERLFVKIMDARADGVGIRYSWIKAKASKIIETMNEEEKPDIDLSPKWIFNFMKRYDSTIRSVTTTRIPATITEQLVSSFEIMWANYALSIKWPRKGCGSLMKRVCGLIWQETQPWHLLPLAVIWTQTTVLTEKKKMQIRTLYKCKTQLHRDWETIIDQ